MTATSLHEVLRRLNEAGVSYLVAGGLAVVAHGHVRLTQDLDLLLALDDANVARAITVLKALRYRPVVTAVTLDDLADPSKRRSWVEEKNAKVLGLWSEEHRLTPIDVFVDPPVVFADAASRSVRLEIAPGVLAPFVSIEDLLAMKRKAGRPQDLLDIEALERLRKP